MPGQGKRTGIKYHDIYPEAGRQAPKLVDFEGGKVQIVNIWDDDRGGVQLDLDTHEGPRSRLSLYGEWRDYGDGFEFVETGHRDSW